MKVPDIWGARTKTPFVRYETPDEAWTAFEAKMGAEGGALFGEGEDGEEMPLLRPAVVSGMRMFGMWGFCDGETIHAWVSNDAPVDQAILFFAHELAHLHKVDCKPDDEEAWADKVGDIAREAYNLANIFIKTANVRDMAGYSVAGKYAKNHQDDSWPR